MSIFRLREQYHKRESKKGEKRAYHSDSPPFDHVSKQLLTLFKTSIGLGVSGLR
jgi:hypothetical protein